MNKNIKEKNSIFNTDENITIKNIKAPFKINYWKSYQYISKWLLDKVKVNAEFDKNWKININPHRVSKIEVYNYFQRKDIDALLKYLQTKKFNYTTDTSKFHKIFNPILRLEWKYITWRWKILEDQDFANYKWYYYVDFVRVLVHRNRTYLIKSYYNISENKSFFKLEITYSYQKKKYYLHFLDWLNACKWMNEIIKKIEDRFEPKGYDEDFSKQITFDAFVFQILWKIWKSWVNHIYNIFSILTWEKYKMNWTE